MTNGILCIRQKEVSARKLESNFQADFAVPMHGAGLRFVLCNRQHQKSHVPALSTMTWQRRENTVYCTKCGTNNVDGAKSLSELRGASLQCIWFRRVL